MSFKTTLTPNDDVVGIFYEMFKESLGLPARVRCIVDGEQQDADYLQDVVEILKHLDIEKPTTTYTPLYCPGCVILRSTACLAVIAWTPSVNQSCVQHPVGSYLLNVFQGHKDVYGCGVRSLLFFTCQLYKQVKQLVEQGIHLHYLEDLLNEAVKDCISDLQPVTVLVTVEPTPPAHALVTCPLSMVTDIWCTEKFYPCAVSTLSSPYIQLDRSTSLPVSSSVIKTRNAVPGQGIVTHSSVLVNKSDSQSTDKVSGTVEHHTGNCGSALRAQTILSTQTCNSMFRKLDNVSGAGVSVDMEYVELPQRKGEKWNKDLTTSSSNLQCMQPAYSQDLNLAESGQVSSGNLSDLLLHCKKHKASSYFQNQILLRSRHLQQCKTVTKAEDFQNLEPHSHPLKGNAYHPDRLWSETKCSGSVSTAETQQNAMYISGMSQERCSQKSAGLSCELTEEIQETLTCLSLPAKADALSHNCDAMMPWAGEVMRQQLLYGRLSKFDVNLVHTSEISGQHGSHHLLHGLAVLADADAIQAVSSIRSPSSKVLLVQGDLTADYKHKGHKVSLSATQVTGAEEFIHRDRSNWHDQVINLLLTLEVCVVLVQGVVDSNLKDLALSDGIALLDHVPFQALTVLKTACKVDFLTYILDAHEGNICMGVTLKPLLENWCDSLHPGHEHLVITIPVFIQTLVISSPSAAGRSILKEEFWHSIARLAQAAEDGRVLKGGGVTECWCAHRLVKSSPHKGAEGIHLKWPDEVSLYRPVVRAALADVFLTYKSTVQQNQTRFQKAGSLHTPTISSQTSSSSPNPSLHEHRKKSLRGCESDICKKMWSSNPPCLDSKLLEPLQNPFPDNAGTSSPCHNSHLSHKNLLPDLSAEKNPCLGEVSVCDTYSSKVNGWCMAVSCVCTVMRMDSLITTGIQQQQQPAQHPGTVML